MNWKWLLPILGELVVIFLIIYFCGIKIINWSKKSSMKKWGQAPGSDTELSNFRFYTILWFVVLCILFCMAAYLEV